MNPLRIKSLLLAMAALVAFATAIAAQVTGGAVTGTVLDPDGSAVVGATVSLKDKSRGLDFTAQTTGAGSYQFTNVPTGTYTITVTATGFAESTGQVLVSLNQTVTADVALTITAGTAVVNITSGMENIVQTDTSQVATTFQQRQFQDLPVNQNPNNLALLAPNVTSPPIGVSGEGAITGGLRQRSNSFSIDGVDNNDVGVSGSVRGVIPDTVSEFSFLQNNFNAEFSSGGAGLFNTITKSGTNTYHGSVFGYFDRERFNARATDEDGTTKRRFKQNRYGGTVGGPLLFPHFGEGGPAVYSGKDHLFFFFAYQKTTFDGEGGSSGYIAPTSAGLAKIAALPGVSPYVIGLVNQSMPLASSKEFDNCDAVNGTGPILGTCGIDMGTVNAVLPNANATKSYQFNVDAIVNAKNQLRFRYYWYNFSSADGVLVPLFASDTSQQQRSFSANWIGNLSSTIVNDFRFGYIKSAT